MSESRPDVYLEQMKTAASDACTFVEGLDRHDFLSDRRTQNAVIMSLIVIGEAATRLMDKHPTFAARHADVGWGAMRGMRNRIAHGYFKIDMDVVWTTVQTALPDLLKRLNDIQETRDGAAS